MKHSEMVLKLAVVLNKAYTKEEHSPTNLAVEVLELLWNEGMRPPQYVGILATGEKFNKDIHQGTDVHIFQCWEPE